MIATAFAVAVVVGILAVVAYAVFEVSPFAHHRDVFRRPGERQQSPRLD